MQWEMSQVKDKKTKKKINEIENILVNMKSSVKANALADRKCLDPTLPTLSF